MWQWPEIGTGGRTELFPDADALRSYVARTLATSRSELKVIHQVDDCEAWSVIASAPAIARWSSAMPLRGLLASRWRLAQFASMTDAGFEERLRMLLEAALSAGLYSPEVAERLCELASEALLAEQQANCMHTEAVQRGLAAEQGR